MLRKDYNKHNYDNLQIHNSLFITYFEDFQTKLIEQRRNLEEKIIVLESSQKRSNKSSNDNFLTKKRKILDNYAEEELKKEEEDKRSNNTQDDDVVNLNFNDAVINEDGLKNSQTISFKETTIGIRINDNDIYASGKSSKSRFAFGFYASKNASIFSWKIHIRKIVNWIGLGICSKENIELNNYTLNKIGNFLYAITSDGKIYENKDPVQEHFSLKANDILDISFNSDLNTLLFKKEKLNITLYNVIPPKQGSILVPCVILNDRNDNVTFI